MENKNCIHGSLGSLFGIAFNFELLEDGTEVQLSNGRAYLEHCNKEIIKISSRHHGSRVSGRRFHGVTSPPRQGEHIQIDYRGLDNILTTTTEILRISRISIPDCRRWSLPLFSRASHRLKQCNFNTKTCPGIDLPHASVQSPTFEHFISIQPEWRPRLLQTYR
jgi:hypothetical protein